MKKTAKSFIAIAIVSLFAATGAYAADKDAKPADGKIAGCCVKAQSAGKDCTHACCVAAAKEGNNCAKCGGSGAMAKPAKK